MTTIVEHPLSVSRLYQYYDVIGLLSGGGPGFSGPVSLALGPDGLLHVASRANPNQPEAVRVTRCSIEGDHVGEFCGWGEAPGQFIWVTAITFGPDGNLYLSDENKNRITKFTAEGEFLDCWGEFGSNFGQMNRPSGMAFAPDGTLVIADSLNHRIQRFTADGHPLATWGENGAGLGQLNMPWGVAVDSAGTVYVSDWRNDRIQKFDADGRFLAEFDGEGRRGRVLTAERTGGGRCRTYLRMRLVERPSAGVGCRRKSDRHADRPLGDLQVGQNLPGRQSGH